MKKQPLAEAQIRRFQELAGIIPLYEQINLENPDSFNPPGQLGLWTRYRF